MKLRILLSIPAIAIYLSACSSYNPMQTSHGPMNTPIFDPIVIDTVKDGSKKVHFKEWTVMYEDKKSRIAGVFFITDNGAYMANWDTQGYKYDLTYKIDATNIDSISDSKVIRDFWPDSNLLVITDKKGHEVGFSLRGRNAARAFLQNISSK